MAGLFKITVLGALGSGKTNVAMKFVHREFGVELDPLKEVAYRKSIEVNGFMAMLEILDTAPVWEKNDQTTLRMREADGFIVVYDITSKSSMEDAKMYLNWITEARQSPNFPKALVGAKLDIADETSRQVPIADGQALATDHHAVFFEVSSKHGTNIDEAFTQLVRAIDHFKCLQTAALINHKEKKSDKCVMS